MNFSGFQAAGISEAEPLMHLVADQIAQLPWQSPREFGRNVDVLVLLLAQPSERVGEEHAVAPRVRSVCARTV